MGKKQIIDFEQIRALIRSNGMDALDDLYISFQDEFMRFGRKYTTDADDIADIYQDTIIAFYDQVRKPGKKEIKCSLKTYIFSIGKHKIINLGRRKGRSISIDDENHNIEFVDWEERSVSLDDRQLAVLGQLQKIGGKCKELLELFYYHGYRIEAIKRQMNYASENAVKVTKSNCMKKLRELVSKKQS